MKIKIITKDGRVIGVYDYSRVGEVGEIRLEEEFDYKVEEYWVCKHKTEEEHDARCWRF